VCVTLGHATNNVAEYRGLISGLEAARDLGVRRLLVKGDSLLVVNQASICNQDLTTHSTYRATRSLDCDVLDISCSRGCR